LPTPPGTVLHNHYRIERLIAIGGFGAVYLATDLKAGNRPVAIKDMICADPQEFAIRLNFFRREAEILRALENLPVVPRLYELIEQGQTAHLVLEFIRGQDLLKLMENNGNRAFPADLVMEWGKSICDVLTVMHGMTPPLVHRDLKPDNIMLMEDGRSIKMIDFGTARDLGRTSKDRQAAKTRVYTEGYAPPEQIVGKPEPRSDLFALAGTLYHLLTGKSPEGFYSARDLNEQLVRPNPPFPAEHRWLYELIKINLAEDAKDRYFSAREIKSDLEKKKVTREVTCPKCQQVNKVREPYCSRCAEPLTDLAPPCHNCGKANRMGSRHCIHCGNHLR
jgi:serine/threonine protein kinase